MNSPIISRKGQAQRSRRAAPYALWGAVAAVGLLSGAFVWRQEAIEHARPFFSGMGRSSVKGQISAARPGRVVYPYSVVPGGVHGRQELIEAVDRDPVVAEHYRGFDRRKAIVVTLAEPKLAYVSYRMNNRVYYTSKRLRLEQGETVMTDGTSMIRTRCGNRVMDSAQSPVHPDEPAETVLDSSGGSYSPQAGATPGSKSAGEAAREMSASAGYPQSQDASGGTDSKGLAVVPPTELTPPGTDQAKHAGLPPVGYPLLGGGFGTAPFGGAPSDSSGTPTAPGAPIDGLPYTPPGEVPVGPYTPTVTPSVPPVTPWVPPGLPYTPPVAPWTPPDTTPVLPQNPPDVPPVVVPPVVIPPVVIPPVVVPPVVVPPVIVPPVVVPPTPVPVDDPTPPVPDPPSEVPEPSTYWLIGAGLLALALLRRPLGVRLGSPASSSK